MLPGILLNDVMFCNGFMKQPFPHFPQIEPNIFYFDLHCMQTVNSLLRNVNN